MGILTHFHKGPADYPVLDWPGYHVRTTPHATRPFPPNPADIKSVLVIKLDALGDYLLHTPFYAGLRKLYPHAKLTLLCNYAVQHLAQHNSNFDHVLAPSYATGHDQRLDLMFAIQMQNHEAAPFDLIIMPRWAEDLHGAGIIAQTLDAPYRITYSARCHPNKAVNFYPDDDYYTHLIDDPRPAHEVWRGMQFLHALGAEMPPITQIKQEIHLIPEDHDKINSLLSAPSYPRPWIALGVGATVKFKCWPPEHYAELAKQISSTMGGTIFLIGNGKYDDEHARIIEERKVPGVVNLVSQLAVRETVLLISKCDAMVCNDSFTLHAAATYGLPIVEIVGHPADGNPQSEYLPWHYGPWGAPFAWLQPITCNGSENVIPDYRGSQKCIADVAPSDVFIALTEVMKRWPKLD